VALVSASKAAMMPSADGSSPDLGLGANSAKASNTIGYSTLAPPSRAVAVSGPATSPHQAIDVVTNGSDDTAGGGDQGSTVLQGKPPAKEGLVASGGSKAYAAKDPAGGAKTVTRAASWASALYPSPSLTIRKNRRCRNVYAAVLVVVILVLVAAGVGVGVTVWMKKSKAKQQQTATGGKQHLMLCNRCYCG
jgi:hypothetical protein